MTKAVGAAPLLTITALSLLTLTTAARADLKLCNRMSYVIEAAIGIDDKGSTATRGWFKIDPAQCRVVLQGALTADRVMLNARALALYGASPIPQNGTDRLCVTSDNFVIAAARQCRGGQTVAAFTEIKPRQNDDGDLVAYLAEDSEYDDEQARLAGIQRLLGIAGYDTTPIDGVDGPKTQAALATFLRKSGLKADAAAAPDIFDTLVKAVESPSATGLTWCNDTKSRVMAAVAEDNGKIITSRGWYRIEAGKCLRPDLSAQPKRVFSFAEAVDDNARPILIKGKALNWGGATLLCTRDTKFEISEQGDCSARGLNAVGFAPVDLSRGGQTLRFTTP